MPGCNRRLQSTTTITVRDTVLVRPAARVDTQLVTRPADTIRLVRDRLRVQLIRQHDTLRLQASCQADTVRIPVVRVVTQPASAHNRPPWLWLLLGALLAVLLVVWLRR